MDLSRTSWRKWCGARGGATAADQEQLFFLFFFLCFVPVPKLNRDIKLFFIPVGPPGINAQDILSRRPNPGWETGTKDCSQPGQIKCSVVVEQRVTKEKG